MSNLLGTYANIPVSILPFRLYTVPTAIGNLMYPKYYKDFYFSILLLLTSIRPAYYQRRSTLIKYY